MSPETAKLLDAEVRHLIDRCYARSRELLSANMDKLHAMAAALMKYETIDVGVIDAIMEGREPSPPADWSIADDIANTPNVGPPVGPAGGEPVAAGVTG